MDYSLIIYSQDGEFLETTKSFYIRRDFRNVGLTKDSSVRATNPTNPAVYIPELIKTSIVNNNCLIGHGLLTSRDGTQFMGGILRTRFKNRHQPTEINKYTLSETQNKYTDPSPVHVITRGIKEELGSVIPERFIQTFSPAERIYVCVVEPSTKPIIIRNYQRLLPLTELYDVQWVSISTSARHRENLRMLLESSTSLVVQPNDIGEAETITLIDKALPLIDSTAPLPIQKGSPTISPITEREVYVMADHGINLETRPVPGRLRRGGGRPPVPPQKEEPREARGERWGDVREARRGTMEARRGTMEARRGTMEARRGTMEARREAIGERWGEPKREPIGERWGEPRMEPKREPKRELIGERWGESMESMESMETRRVPIGERWGVPASLRPVIPGATGRRTRKRNKHKRRKRTQKSARKTKPLKLNDR